MIEAIFVCFDANNALTLSQSDFEALISITADVECLLILKIIRLKTHHFWVAFLVRVVSDY